MGFIGSFYAYEGLDLLLAALPQVTARIPDARVLLVGGGPQENELKALAAKLGIEDRVVFAGRVPHGEVQRYYGIVDVFAYPRKSMRLTELVTPLKPLEAMAQGRLLVASDVGGHRELIRDGETGVLFRAGDAASLADAIVRLLGQRDRWPQLARPGPPVRRTGAHLGNERGRLSRGIRFTRPRHAVTLSGRRIGLVGPLPPPAGGMANQTRQLAELLEREGRRGHARANQRPLSAAIHRVHSRPARPVPARAVRAPPLARRRSSGRRSRHGQFRLVVALVRRAGDMDRALAPRPGRGQLPWRRGRYFPCALRRGRFAARCSARRR